MASVEQWVYESEGETYGPFPTRSAAIKAALTDLSRYNKGGYEAVQDVIVEALDNEDLRVQRLSPPKTLS